ncbi:MAG: hypothetical protein QXK07_05365 [Desulfurococcaceae archaeon]
MRYLRGDLSAPVLAILVTIGIIAAGLILLAWFWWFAPQAGRTGTLQILGTPAIDESGRLYISVRNVGTETVTIDKIYVEGVECQIQDSSNKEVPPGPGISIVAECSGVQDKLEGKPAVTGVIVTDYGTYSFTAAVIKTPITPTETTPTETQNGGEQNNATGG